MCVHGCGGSEKDGGWGMCEMWGVRRGGSKVMGWDEMGMG